MEKEENRFHSKTISECLKELKSNQNGLSEEEADSRRVFYGFNIISEKKQLSPVLMFIKQFHSLMIYILFFAALISLFMKRYIDVYVILGVIFINSAIGFFQEYKAEKAIKALKSMIVPQAKVYRGGEIVQIPAKYLVPGDILQLDEGDKIPADSKLIEIDSFRTVESSLTGESLPVDKILKPLPEKTELADRKNMVWLGTFVASGKARAVVVSTGKDTAIGRLARTIEEIKPKKSHFKEKTDTLAKYLAFISLTGATIIFIVGFFFRDLPFADALIFTIASLVSAIPEGLPAVLASVLAIGAYRMAKRNAIIRNRYATETLSIVDTILTDKTGTLTQNTMSVQHIVIPGQQDITVTGEGWNPQGLFYQNKKQIIPLENKHLTQLFHIASFCNNSRLMKKETRENERAEEEYEIIGDPTEAALLVLAEKAGLKRRAILEKEKRIDEVPFSPALKYRASLSVLWEKNKKKEVYVVGAPEAVIKNSLFILKNGRKTRLTSRDKEILESKINYLTGKAMRVLGLAYKEVNKGVNEIHEKDTSELIFVGLVGMTDPPRKEVKEAIAKTKEAGIRVIIVTGDHKNTAIAVAKEIGLVSENKNRKYPLALTGAELEQMSHKEFVDAINNVFIFARLAPAMKLKIAKALQSQGKIVAVTGDGVNDAPALKQADIGISMGKIGTDVARETSEIVLADDNFASIINAVEEGRTVFINTRQTSFFLVATGFAEHATIITTLLMGLPLPLLPLQILWLNLVTAGVPSVAIATEQVHHDILNDKPRKEKENILNKELLPFLALLTAIMLILTLFVFNKFLPEGVAKARTAAFTVMSLIEIFSMYTMRSIKRPIFEFGVFSNKFVNLAFISSFLLLLIVIYVPFLREIFSFAIISFKELVFLFVISSSVFWFGELYKSL